MAGFFSKLFSMGEGKQQRLFDAKVDEINALEDDIKKLSDEELRAKTDEFRSRIDDGETLDEILAEAFAVVREASVRSTGMRHFDVQLIGGIALHEGKIAEMKTGEGKTQLPLRAFKYPAKVDTSVLPSPVFISAILPSCKAIPPIN